jgi:transposase
MFDTADLPYDVTALKAMLIAAQAREAAKDVQIVRKDERIERLEKLVAAFRQAAFGRKSEKTDAEPVRSGTGRPGNGHGSDPCRG